MSTWPPAGGTADGDPGRGPARKAAPSQRAGASSDTDQVMAGWFTDDTETRWRLDQFPHLAEAKDSDEPEFRPLLVSARTCSMLRGKPQGRVGGGICQHLGN
jgi:hypothetical protein